ncbi:copper homeostasis protein [Carnobacterium iners]|uniref:PF03932 family protein CutC n=1 Tax=Carnobacterium iners TaxID=1073423 RepID=A0A1X7NQ19_9LACT|nr:copper homeostasis protein CutC [Carnobacterium iners]SEK29750.1 copper homeostasis protein [Carnobacterium iners]SMH39706.1 copper homeostasis protein [Carnobacterium iners]
MFLKEVCVENYTVVPSAIAKGATRVELCNYLPSGGTTVSKGVMQETLAYCSEYSVPVMVIIRPRSGNFVYNDTELKIMGYDIIEAKNLGIDGIVVGCLTEENWIDEDAMEQILEESYGLQTTFHMAFDSIPKDRQFEAIDWLVEHGVERILTHGGVANHSIEITLPRLKELVDYANNKIIILPGGGITDKNASQVIEFLGINEVHGTKIVGKLA